MSLDLAALLCSRICHDVISPVGAITNGLEVLDEDDSGDMREVAMDLIRKSARQASARLQFARLAFGFAGSAGASIDLADAERLAKGYVDSDKTSLDWRMPAALVAKDRVKLLLTLIVLALQAIPRGGSIRVWSPGSAEIDDLTVVATGSHARIPAGIEDLIAGTQTEPLDAHSVVPYYVGLLARSVGLAIRISRDGDVVTFVASSRAAA
ncbi:histidine phosphotransferase ChpT [Pseudoxanthobacter soli DSM 19599]|uniref:Histidine phosphotransferase ChpT n=1 Tax=Pseudoxanthobacter soli DSM 19599 TaxID=1123029 RepID=A0A1M7ZNQ0_9HYPH|nr:histidine phosphotransferase family protein [Pseudoxanthobacter soli]SHO66286.1 histidine phosphotransferase ChpT [Pseudoxanthobacter soli DSM 19599]